MPTGGDLRQAGQGPTRIPPRWALAWTITAQFLAAVMLLVASGWDTGRPVLVRISLFVVASGLGAAMQLRGPMQQLSRRRPDTSNTRASSVSGPAGTL